MNKVAIIGCGNVGMSFAYALLNQKTFVNELVLIDLDQKRIEGEVMDLNHCLAFAPTKMNIKVGTYEDCRDAKIVCIAAGANQKIGETRMDLIDKNRIIFKDIVTSVLKHGFQGIFLVATNPLDVMTYLVYHYAKIDPKRVIGTGTCLDTARLRYLIGEKLNINPKNIHADVIGEHGDSEFIPWTCASVGMQSIKDYLNKEEMETLHQKVKNAAYDIIEKKGATYYGIGMCLVAITNAILGDEHSIMTLSSYDEKNDCFIGGATILTKNGAEKRIYIQLSEEEEQQLQQSIDVIKKAIAHTLQ